MYFTHHDIVCVWADTITHTHLLRLSCYLLPPYLPAGRHDIVVTNIDGSVTVAGGLTMSGRHFTHASFDNSLSQTAAALPAHLPLHRLTLPPRVLSQSQAVNTRTTWSGLPTFCLLAFCVNHILRAFQFLAHHATQQASRGNSCHIVLFVRDRAQFRLVCIAWTLGQQLSFPL